jgi:hypothetical protein
LKKIRVIRSFLIVTAALEAGAGLALVLVPEFAVWLLLGTTLDSATAIVVSRIAGAELLSLGVACWLSRNAPQSPATAGIIVAMLLYNLSVAILLAMAVLGSGLHGLLLWPGVVLHTAMATWCAICLRHRQSRNSNSSESW